MPTTRNHCPQDKTIALEPPRAEHPVGEGSRAQRRHDRDRRLACAVARGDAAALRALKEMVARVVGAALGRLQMADLADEIGQRVLVELTVGERGRPAIARYQGKGSLRAWIRVIAVRMAQRERRRQRRHCPQREHQIELACVELSPELVRLKAGYRVHFKRAFSEALATLTPQQRNILRYEVNAGLTLDQTAALYGVHRATVARWRRTLRAALLDKILSLLQVALGAERGDLDNLVGLIRSQLDLSLSRLLAETPPSAA